MLNYFCYRLTAIRSNLDHNSIDFDWSNVRLAQKVERGHAIGLIEIADDVGTTHYVY